MHIIETERLFLREINGEDAGFILELVNEPGWLKNIGDRGIRTLEAARECISNVYVAGYEKFGFGLYLVGLKESNQPVGVCGLIKRDALEHVDIGFAFLERFQGKGYAVESALAVMKYAEVKIGLKRVVAITVPDNTGSIKVLEKIGLKFEKMIRLPGSEEELKLFARDF